MLKKIKLVFPYLVTLYVFLHGITKYLEFKMTGASLGYDKTPYLWYIHLIIQNEGTI